MEVNSCLVIAPQELPQAPRIREVAKRKTAVLSLLEFENNVEAILPLFQKALDDVVEFAALLLSALEKKVSGKQIINSGIIKKFIAYYFPYSCKENNEINQLREILKHFSGTTYLREKINLIYLQYSQHFPVDYYTTAFTVQFTFSVRNFRNLASLFGDFFLMSACVRLAETNNHTLREWLKNHLNGLASADLAIFIKKIGKTNKVDLLQLMVEMLSANSVQTLFNNHEGAVFYLAAYQSAILERVSTTETLQNYLSVLKENGETIYDIVGQLAFLLENITNENHPAKDLLFEELLNLVLENPALADDGGLIFLLANEASRQRALITLKEDILFNTWDTALNELLSKNDYMGAEDLWCNYSKVFTILKHLGHKTNFPDNKYEFYAYLVKIRIAQADFQLADFLKAVLPFEEPEGVSSKERTLIEILAAVDNENIRRTAIDLLELTPRKNGLWISHIYGQRDSVLTLAAQYGNLGLIKLLFSSTNILTPESAATADALHNATALGHLAIVQFLCELQSANKPGKDALSVALNLAAKLGKLSIVQFLYQLDSIAKLDKKVFNQAFAFAVGDRQLPVMHFFCNLLMQGKLGPDKTLVASVIGRFDENSETYKLLNNSLKIMNLRDSITQLKKHGENLQSQRAFTELGGYAVAQAETLAQLTNEYVDLWVKDPYDENLRPIRRKFEANLQESYRNMGKHRHLWKPILANIAIAATGIGILFLLAKFIASGTGFFAETARQNKIHRIEELYAELTLNNH